MQKENIEISYQISKSGLYYEYSISFFKKQPKIQQIIPRNSSNLKEIVQFSCHLPKMQEVRIIQDWDGLIKSWNGMSLRENVNTLTLICFYVSEYLPLISSLKYVNWQ